MTKVMLEALSLSSRMENKNKKCDFDGTKGQPGVNSTTDDSTDETTRLRTTEVDISKKMRDCEKRLTRSKQSDTVSVRFSATPLFLQVRTLVLQLLELYVHDSQIFKDTPVEKRWNDMCDRVFQME